MLNKKFEKQVDIIISDEFKEVLKANNDPFYEYFYNSIEEFFPDVYETTEVFIRSDIRGATHD